MGPRIFTSHRTLQSHSTQMDVVTGVTSITCNALREKERKKQPDLFVLLSEGQICKVHTLSVDKHTQRRHKHADVTCTLNKLKALHGLQL